MCETKQQKLEGIWISRWRMELFRIELVNPDEALLCRLLKCQAVNRWVISEPADGLQWLLVADRDSLAQLATRAQFSFVPASPLIRQCVVLTSGQDRVWINGEGLLVATKDGEELESLPEVVTPEIFALLPSSPSAIGVKPASRRI